MFKAPVLISNTLSWILDGKKISSALALLPTDYPSREHQFAPSPSEAVRHLHFNTAVYIAELRRLSENFYYKTSSYKHLLIKYILQI